jgi:hypothetical protein
MVPEQDPSGHPPGHRRAAQQLLILVINFLGFAGIMLVFYGIALYLTGELYRPLEQYAEALGILGTILGVSLTTISIYLPVNTRPPDELSKRYTAPAVLIVTAVITLLYLSPPLRDALGIWLGVSPATPIPVHVFNGLALLGLAGALFRLLSR